MDENNDVPMEEEEEEEEEEGPEHGILGSDSDEGPTCDGWLDGDPDMIEVSGGDGPVTVDDVGDDSDEEIGDDVGDDGPDDGKDKEEEKVWPAEEDKDKDADGDDHGAEKKGPWIFRLPKNNFSVPNFHLARDPESNRPVSACSMKIRFGGDSAKQRFINHTVYRTQFCSLCRPELPPDFGEFKVNPPGFRPVLDLRKGGR